jgi:Tfp pilus assembly protein PilF
MKKNARKMTLLTRADIISILLVAILGALFGGLFNGLFHLLIDRFPKIFQQLYNLFYFSIPLNIAIILTLIIFFFIIVFRYRKKGIILIVLLFLIFSLGTIASISFYQMQNIKDKTFIIIAKFEDLSKQASINIDGRIYDVILKDKISSPYLNSLVIERIPIVIKNKEEANKEVKNSIWRKAKIVIVIWGKTDDIGGTAYFDVIKAPQKQLMVKTCIEKETSVMEDIKSLNFSYYKEILPATINFLSYLTFGLNCYYENNYTDALVYFNESLNKFPIPRDEKMNEYLSNIYFLMGVSYSFLDNLTLAEDKYRESVRISIKNSIVHNNLGNLLSSHPICHGFLKYYNEIYDEAEEEFKEAIRINPNNADAHNNLGNLWRVLRYYEKAEEQYREALRINPDLAEVHNNLGYLLLDIGRKEEAKKVILKAMELFEKQGKSADVKRCNELLNNL